MMQPGSRLKGSMPARETPRLARLTGRSCTTSLVWRTLVLQRPEIRFCFMSIGRARRLTSFFFIAHKENEAHEIAGCEHETSRWCNHALHIRTVTSVIEDTGVYEGRQFPASRVDISAPRCTRRRCRGSRVGGYRRPRYRLLPMLCGFRNLCQS